MKLCSVKVLNFAPENGVLYGVNRSFFVKKWSVLSLLFLLSYPVAAQQHLEGYVYEANSKEPLFGAAVYYEGTTKGTITDPNGKFTIDLTERSTSAIVISYLGYQDQMIKYGAKPIIVYLKPKLESLGEVIIQGNLPFTREEMVQAFREQFLGRTVAGRSCKILNEDALYFYYDTTTFSLKATADESLIVQNKYLGYEIRYSLYDFQVDFRSKSVNFQDELRSYYAGTSFYKDLKPGEKKYIRRRKKAFKGSILQLMRIIAAQDFNAQDYRFFRKSFPVDPNVVFEVSNFNGLKKVIVRDKITLLYRNVERSSLRPMQDYFTIDGYGNHLANSLIFTGVMGFERLGDSLPLDYGL